MLQCRYSTSGSFLNEACVPRSIVFETIDGNFVGPIWALKVENVASVKSGVQSHLYTYEISTEDFNKIGRESFKTISFWDKRTLRSVVASPYADLLKEQVQCLVSLSKPIK
jgi:hypothetical protein